MSAAEVTRSASQEECPDPSVHGSPFRYCPYCDWIEPARESTEESIVSGCRFCGGSGCEECSGTGQSVISPLSIDGNVVMVHGNRTLDDKDRVALAEVYRAAIEMIRDES